MNEAEDRDRREDASRAEVTIPTRDRPYSRIGNSMIRPKARNIVVTKSKYGPAAMLRDQVLAREAEQELDRVRQDEVREPDPEREEHERDRDPRPDGPSLARRSARAR